MIAQNQNKAPQWVFFFSPVSLSQAGREHAWAPWQHCKQQTFLAFEWRFPPKMVLRVCGPAFFVVNTGSTRWYHCGRKWNEISWIVLVGLNHKNLSLALSRLFFSFCRSERAMITSACSHTCVCLVYLRLLTDKALICCCNSILFVFLMVEFTDQ